MNIQIIHKYQQQTSGKGLRTLLRRVLEGRAIERAVLVHIAPLVQGVRRSSSEGLPRPTKRDGRPSGHLAAFCHEGNTLTYSRHARQFFDRSISVNTRHAAAISSQTVVSSPILSLILTNWPRESQNLFRREAGDHPMNAHVIQAVIRQVG